MLYNLQIFALPTNNASITQEHNTMHMIHDNPIRIVEKISVFPYTFSVFGSSQSCGGMIRCQEGIRCKSGAAPQR